MKFHKWTGNYRLVIQVQWKKVMGCDMNWKIYEDSLYLSCKLFGSSKWLPNGLPLVAPNVVGSSKWLAGSSKWLACISEFIELVLKTKLKVGQERHFGSGIWVYSRQSVVSLSAFALLKNKQTTNPPASCPTKQWKVSFSVVWCYYRLRCKFLEQKSFGPS